MPSPSRTAFWITRLGLWVILPAATIALGAALTGWLILRASLPRLSGTLTLPGLAQPVQVNRDDLAIASIEAQTPTDLARAIGFVHAQERFFQMDLLRRTAAGELAELIGPPLVQHDQARRIHQMRNRARRIHETLPSGKRALMEAYSEGANAGLEALGARPPEYFALRQRPAPWKPEDSILVVQAMAFDLQDADAETERALGDALAALGPAAFAFYLPTGTEWEAPLDATATPPAPIPIPAEFTAPPMTASTTSAPGDDLFPGSNAWAVSGRRTRHGAALVADDMHLGLRMPNIWFRMSLRWSDAADGGRLREVTGVSLPGVPAIVTGSNTRIAWGFTNATTDHSDLINLECDAEHPDQYRVPEGWEPFHTETETLVVAGQAPQVFRFRTTRWGPVQLSGPGTRPRAIHWSFHYPEAVNLGLLEIATATNVQQALDLASRAGIPAQNFVVGDREGHIGWTLTGIMPARAGATGRLPASWANPTNGWRGWVPAEMKPRVMDPPEGILWSANQRMLGTAAYRAAGDGDFDLGARAGQIRDRLRPLLMAGPADMLAIQTDVEARFLSRWRNLMLQNLQLLDASTNAPSEADVRQVLEGWGGAASTNSAGFLLVRTFRRELMQRLLEPAVETCRLHHAGFPWTHHTEAPAWTLLQHRPPHLLSRRFQNYEELLREALRVSVRACATVDGRFRTWGERNVVRIQHPLSMAVPQLARWLDIPPEPMPGDSHMPRAQGTGFGASERFGVSPGHESEGYCHMPGGQSGHFLSPYYRAGHREWAEGLTLPFLPGATTHQLVLVPRADGRR